MAIPHFAHGFADVWADEETGHVIAQTPTGWMPVFPADSLSNYFYLRHERKAKTTATEALYDGGVTLQNSIDVRLISVSSGVCSKLLLQHLLKAVSGNLSVTGLDWNREYIIASELSDADEDTVIAALQRAGGYDLLRIDFTLYQHYQPDQCLPPLC